MFSANENVLLRQHKKRIVALVEETIPEDCLDLGVQVMVMEVKCQAPGCVPLETVILIVFPKAPNQPEGTYLLPGLPQSNGGNFKTKILMPMANVTKDDVLDALPPQFTGGRRSISKLALQARDVMLGQITQLFDDKESRKLMAEYLQKQLQEFVNRDCEEPVWGQEYESTTTNSASLEDATTQLSLGESTISSGPEFDNTSASLTSNDTLTNQTQQMDLLRNSNKNVVIRRVLDSTPPVSSASALPAITSNAPTSVLPIESVAARRRQQNWSRALSSAPSPLQLLTQRQHAPGLRPVGCPCCDPDNPSNVADQFLHL
ncbi:hypothetical protein FisN_9Hh054 [Fistulifera solaris]|uniref:Uncharacterized protein n=1 Tax=Fistulifera solaris TaxID=1519565 RepID=A0A1Z5K264_FISSO|nr:hypothetical protein FisN_9Hh054 [Fistulifera solaris]|eukprot:GAX20345.1 hypothetical protein FisN_9Hh054 [Fistulifera solaris]